MQEPRVPVRQPRPRLHTRCQSAVYDQADAVRVAERLPDGVAEEDEIARLDVFFRKDIGDREGELLVLQRNGGDSRNPLRDRLRRENAVGTG